MEFGEIRAIEGDTIVSPSSPRARIRITSNMIYLGDLQYLLHQKNRVQEFFFIDVNGIGHVTRMLLVHFEGFLEGKEGAYDYPVNKIVHLNGQEFLYDTLFINIQQYIAEHPETAIARAADYIRQRAYTLAGEVVFQRFLRLVDAEKRNELIIAYMESSEKAGVTAKDIETDEAAANALLERALASFKIL